MRFQCKSQWRWLIALTLVLLLFAAGCGSPSTLATSSDPVSQNQSVNNSPTQPQQASPTAVDTIPVKVTRVVDGDTIEIVLNGKTEKVRLIGVDTPETVHPTQAEEPYGREASNFTKAQLDGMQVNLELEPEAPHKRAAAPAAGKVQDQRQADDHAQGMDHRRVGGRLGVAEIT